MTGGTLELPKVGNRPLRVRKSVLRMWDGATLVGNIIVEGTTFVVPTGSYDELVIEGTLMPERIETWKLR